MPLPTFINLNKEKQDKIIDAAMNEFARKKIGEASINKIVKEAEISRGSFYTYFTDKYDLVNYLTAKIKNILLSRIEIKFKSCKNEYMEMMMIIHDEVYLVLEDERYKAFMRNVSLFFHDFPIQSQKAIPMELNHDFELIIKYVDRDKLKDDSDEYLNKLMVISQSILKEVMLNTITQKCSLEKSRNRFYELLLMIEKGYRRI